MLKQHKNFTLASVIILCCCLIIMVSPPVLGLSTYTMLTDPVLRTNTTYDIASGNPARLIFQVQVPDVSLLYSSGDTFTIMVDNIEFSSPGTNFSLVPSGATALTSPYAIYIPPTISGEPNAFATATVSGVVTSSKMADIWATPAAGASGKGGFLIYLNNIKALDKEGDIGIRILAPANSLFSPNVVTSNLSSPRVDVPETPNNNDSDKPVTIEPDRPKITAQFSLNSVSYNVNAEYGTMDVVPYVKNDRTYIPVRYLGYALGMTDDQIIWDETAQKVTLTKGSDTVVIAIGSTVLIKNGINTTMDTAPEMRNNRVMLPVRWITEAFGAEVSWDPTNSTVSISY